MTTLGIDRRRMQAAAGVAAVHGLIGYVLLTGLAPHVVRGAERTLKLFDVAAPPLPPPPPTPEPKQSRKAEGAASPPNFRSRPTLVVAPPPKIRLKPPPPLPSAPKPSPFPPGPDTSAGNAAVAGPGTGSGGNGSGTGSGGSGRGSGGGGSAPAQRISGGLANSDYPRSALRAGAEGSVSVRYTVGTDGRVSGCAVTRSSGHGDLDSNTCRLIEQRFRYRPARDGAGEPVPATIRKTYDWLLPFKARGGA